MDMLHVQEISGDAAPDDRELVLPKALVDGAVGSGYIVSSSPGPAGYTFLYFAPGGSDAVLEEVIGDPGTDDVFLATTAALVPGLETGQSYRVFALPAAEGTLLIVAVPPVA